MQNKSQKYLETTNLKNTFAVQNKSIKYLETTNLKNTLYFNNLFCVNVKRKVKGKFKEDLMTIQKMIYIHLACFSFFVFSQEEENKLEVPENQVEFKEPSQEQTQNSDAVETSNEEQTQNSDAVESGEQTQEEVSDSTEVQEEDSDAVETSNEEQTQETFDAVSQEDQALQLKIKEKISTYEYDPLLREDPFAKPGAVDEVLELGEKIHPLEEEEVESLKLKAIIWSNDGVIPRALFETGNGQTYTVSKNDRIGSRGSVIHRIDRNVVWYMRPVRPPGSEQIRYEPERLPLDGKDPREEQREGGLWYEK